MHNGAVSLRVSAVVLLAVLVGTTASGCVAAGQRDGVLTLSGSDAVEPPTCTVSAPVSVETLDGTDPQACLPLGQELVFPDGYRTQVGECSGNSGSYPGAGFAYHWVTVGRWGLVAARASDDCSEVQRWGHPEALRRLDEAFAPGWACEDAEPSDRG